MSFECNPVEEDPHGECRHEIHRLKRWVDDLQSGMYVNCVYCGHRYGPGDTTPVSMADALKEHVQQCREHPMSALRRERDRLASEVERLAQRLEQFALEITETDTHIRESARRVLGNYVDGDSTCVPPVEEIVERLVKRVEELQTWNGLIQTLDKLYPIDLVPTLPDDPGRDAGARIVSLLRIVDELRKYAERKEIRT